MATTRERNLTIRPPTEADIPGILALIAASDIALTGEADPWSAEDIRGDWIGMDLASDVWVIESGDGTLVGYGMLNDHGSGHLESDGYVHPGYTNRGIGTALLRLHEKRGREIAAHAPAGEQTTIYGGTLANDAAAHRLFAGAGYTPARHFWRMRIDMTGAPLASQWPEGIKVRECVAGQDEERVVFDTLEEAFQDHWGHTPRDYDEWAAVNVRSERFDPALWFLALDGTEPAGAIRCRIMEDGTGFVNTLGVRRPWRKRGLGSALLLQAFGAFYRRGIMSVALGVDAQNPTGATRVYEAAGMRVVREFVVFEKELRSGTASADPLDQSHQENRL